MGFTARKLFKSSNIKLAWNEIPSPVSGVQNWQVTYGGGKFVAVSFGANGAAAYSLNGINWNSTTTPTLDNVKVAYGMGMFITVGYDLNQYSYSYDGVTWILGSYGSHQASSIAYGDGKFISVVLNNESFEINKARVSYNGIDWGVVALPTPTLVNPSIGFYASWGDIHYGQFNSSNRFMITDGYTKIALSTGTSWGSINVPSGSKRQFSSGNNIFVLSSTDNAFLISSNGSSVWSKIPAIMTSNNSSQTSAVGFGNGLFVAAPFLNSVGQAKFATSSNGVNWMTYNFPKDNPRVSSIAYGNNRFVAAGGSQSTSQSSSFFYTT
jgi:hypothetical protein